MDRYGFGELHRIGKWRRYWVGDEFEMLVYRLTEFIDPTPSPAPSSSSSSPPSTSTYSSTSSVISIICCHIFLYFLSILLSLVTPQLAEPNFSHKNRTHARLLGFFAHSLDYSATLLMATVPQPGQAPPQSQPQDSSPSPLSWEGEKMCVTSLSTPHDCAHHL